MVARQPIVAERSTPHAPPVRSHRALRVLGSIVLVRGLANCRRLGQPGGVASRHDPLALYMPACRPGGAALDCPAGGAMLLDIVGATDIPHDGDDDDIVALLPRRIAARPLLDRAAVLVIAPSPELATARRLAATLLASDMRLGKAQAILAGRALGEFVAATLTALPAGRAPRLAAQREASLLDLMTDYIDRHLAEDLGVPALCAALGCSRSALYRAAGPVGGVAARINQRRLDAVHRRLCDAGEQRSIAAVARASGMVDPAAFSRSFKRRFGVTAADLRRDPATAETGRP